MSFEQPSVQQNRHITTFSRTYRQEADKYLSQHKLLECVESLQRALRFDEAAVLEECSREVALRPDRAQALISRGLVYHLLQEDELALRDFNKAICLSANSNLLAYFCRCLLLAEQGREEEAIKDLSKCLQLSPSFVTSFSKRCEQSKSDLFFMMPYVLYWTKCRDNLEGTEGHNGATKTD